MDGRRVKLGVNLHLTLFVIVLLCLCRVHTLRALSTQSNSSWDFVTENWNFGLLGDPAEASLATAPMLQLDKITGGKGAVCDRKPAGSCFGVANNVKIGPHCQGLYPQSRQC